LLTSSLAAHNGCAGQTDYAAANEILNGIASRWNAEVAYPVRALLWGVWAETGLASEALLNQMRQRGLDGIGNAAGTAAFAAELTAAAEGDWVLLSPISTLEYALSAHAA
jgi:hypothetical protein